MPILETALSNALVALVLAAVAAVAGLVCRRPAFVHALWLLVFVKLLTPPLFRVAVPWPVSAEEVREEVAAEEPAEPPAPRNEPGEAAPLPAEPPEPQGQGEAPADAVLRGEVVVLGTGTAGVEGAAEWPAAKTATWQEWLGLAWMTGSACWFALAGWRIVRFARVLRLAGPAPEGLRLRLERLAGQVGLSRCPAVFLIPGRVAPLVWSLGPPAVLVPEGMEERVGAAGLDTLLVHELAHVRRRDHLVRWVEFLALGLYWWHPAVWLASRELREAEEQCCDAWVVRTLPGSGRTYATALVDALDFLSETPVASQPLLASGLGPVADLKRRLTMILRGRTPHALGRAAGLSVVALAVLLLPLMPGFSQGQEPEKKDVVRKRAADPEELERLEAEMAKAKEVMEALRQRIDQAKHERLDARKWELHRAVPGEGGTAIRIEIHAGGMKPDEIKELVAKLEKALPAKGRVTIQVSPGVPRRGILAFSPDGRRIEVDVRPLRPGEPGVPPAPPRPPMPGRSPEAPEGGRRIENLEKKLDAVLRELEALRKEMRGGRQGGTLPGAGAPGRPSLPGGGGKPVSH